MQMASVVPQPALSVGDIIWQQHRHRRLYISITNCLLVEPFCMPDFGPQLCQQDRRQQAVPLTSTWNEALHACPAGDSFSSSTGTGRLASRTSADYSNMGLAESIAQQQEEASELHQQRGTEEPPEANGSHMGPMERGMASWHSSADAVPVMPAADNGPSGQAIQLASVEPADFLLWALL